MNNDPRNDPNPHEFSDPSPQETLDEARRLMQWQKMHNQNPYWQALMIFLSALGGLALIYIISFLIITILP